MSGENEGCSQELSGGALFFRADSSTEIGPSAMRPEDNGDVHALRPLGGQPALDAAKLVARRWLRAEQLVCEYGRSFADKSLRRRMQFAATYPDELIVVTLSRQLSWPHLVALLPLKNPVYAFTEHGTIIAASSLSSPRVEVETLGSARSWTETHHRAADAIHRAQTVLIMFASGAL